MCLKFAAQYCCVPTRGRDWERIQPSPPKGKCINSVVVTHRSTDVTHNVTLPFARHWSRITAWAVLLNSVEIKHVMKFLLLPEWCFFWLPATDFDFSTNIFNDQHQNKTWIHEARFSTNLNISSTSCKKLPGQFPGPGSWHCWPTQWWGQLLDVSTDDRSWLGRRPRTSMTHQDLAL